MKILISTLVLISLTGVFVGCTFNSLEVLLWNFIPTMAIPVVIALYILIDREKPYNCYSKTHKRTKRLRK